MRKEFSKEYTDWKSNVGDQKAEKWLKRVYEVTGVLMKEVAWNKGQQLPEEDEVLLQYTILETSLNAGEERFFCFCFGVLNMGF